MFSTGDRLKKRTPKEGIGRKEYISLLVDEYEETNNIEAQQQVTANLANFAYDPINWNFLKQAKAHELFVEILDSSIDHQLLVHAAAGLCNICLDEQVSVHIVGGGTLKQIKKLIEKHIDSTDLVGHLLTTVFYLHSEPIDADFRNLLQSLQLGSCKRIGNLATVILDHHSSPPTHVTANSIIQ